MKKILFVCTGNVFRSMSAEKIFNKINKTNRLADSCGTFESRQDYIDLKVTTTLKLYKISTKDHKRKKINRKLIEESDIIIAMSKSHKNFIKKTFNINVTLFNQIYKGEKTSIDDIEDIGIDKNNNKDIANKYIKDTITYIYNAMPQFIRNLKDYYEKNNKKANSL